MLPRLRLAVSRVANSSCGWEELPALEKCLAPVLAAASILYKHLLLSLRYKLYTYHLLKPSRLPIPVISIGNISWGGTGKTSMVEYLAWQFVQCGIPPLILTRGYGSGDEARLLKDHLHGSQALIGVGSNRVKIAREFLAKHGIMGLREVLNFTKKLHLCIDHNARSSLSSMEKCQLPLGYQGQEQSTGRRNGMGVALMDDGMQHLKLWRNIELVMVNAVSPFGNERVLPYGPLREPLEALSRADIAVIHHGNLVSCKELLALKERLNLLLPPHATIFCSQMVPHGLKHIPKRTSRIGSVGRDALKEGTNNLAPLSVLRNRHVLCVSGVGCPESLSLTVKQLGVVSVERMDFVDHHNFQKKDFCSIKERLNELSSKLKWTLILIVTEKDYARCPEFFWQFEDYDVFVLCSKLQLMRDCEEFNACIASKLQELGHH